MAAEKKSEKELRIEILQQALALSAGEAATYFHRPESTVARELLHEGLITGKADESGAVGVTGIRDAGRDYLKAQRPLQKFKRAGKRVLFLAYSAFLVGAGYVLGLESVKKWISDFIGHLLP